MIFFFRIILQRKFQVLKLKKKIDNVSPIIASSRFFAQKKFKIAQRQMEMRTRANLGFVSYLNMIHRTQVLTIIHLNNQLNLLMMSLT